ncbi:MAG: oligosaccharide flippase family protein [Lachnospiraceae bacterium]|nr:oligosaccharide flippase family protein [Lachnospiraceae bacterium]
MEKKRGVLIQLIALFARIPLTRIIGDEGNGIYAAAFEMYTILLIISVWCMPDALSHMMRVRIARGQYKNAHGAFKVAFLWNMILSIIACLVLVFGGDYLASYLLMVPMSALTMKMLGPSIIIAGIVASFRGYFQGMGTSMPTVVSNGIQQVVSAAASILASMFICTYGIKVAHLLHNNSFAAAYAVLGIGLGNLIGLFVALLFLLFVFFVYKKKRARLLGKEIGKGNESNGDVIRSMLYILVPLIVTSCIFNVNRILDQILYNGVMITDGNTTSHVVNFGIYAGKYRVLMEIPIVLASTIWLPLIPALEKSYQRVEQKLIRNRIATVYRLSMIVVMPFVVNAVLLARPILNMLFKGNVTLSAQLLQYGSSFILFFSFAMIGNAILQGIGKYKVITSGTLLALMIHIISMMFLLKYLKLDIYAVVYANIIMSIVMCIFNYIFIKKYLKYTPEWLKTVVFPFVAAVISGLIALLIYSVCNGSLGNTAALIIAALISVIAYLFFIVAFRMINEKEIKALPGGSVISRVAKTLQLLPSQK